MHYSVQSEGNPLMLLIPLAVILICLVGAMFLSAALSGWRKIARAYKQANFKGTIRHFRAVRVKRDSVWGFIFPISYFSQYWTAFSFCGFLGIVLAAMTGQFPAVSIAVFLLGFAIHVVACFLNAYGLPMMTIGFGPDGLYLAPPRALWIFWFHAPMVIPWSAITEMSRYEKPFFGWLYVPAHEAWMRCEIGALKITVLIPWRDLEAAKSEFWPAKQTAEPQAAQAMPQADAACAYAATAEKADGGGARATDEAASGHESNEMPFAALASIETQNSSDREKASAAK